MIDEFSIKTKKSQAVASPATENIFKADRSKILNNNKRNFSYIDG